MKRSEFEARLTELFGDDDVDIYFDSTGKSPLLTADFQVFIDGDGDAVIQPD